MKTSFRFLSAMNATGFLINAIQAANGTNFWQVIVSGIVATGCAFCAVSAWESAT
jgi:hypothetical protein